MPRLIDKALADFVMDHIGYSVNKHEGQWVEYRWRHAPEGYEVLVVLFFPEEGIPEDDFRQELSDYQGIPLAVIDSALEQL